MRLEINLKVNYKEIFRKLIVSKEIKLVNKIYESFELNILVGIFYMYLKKK